MENYKLGSRLKLRVASSKGFLSVEQLWDLSLTDLNTIAVALKKEYEQSGQESFLDESTEKDKVVKLKFDIVLDILNTKKEENKIAREKSDIKAHNQKILELIAQKKDDSLKSASIEELEKMLK